MNKAELISGVAQRTGFTKKDSEKMINAVFDTISEALEKGDKVQIIGFGTFFIRTLKEREGYNPARKEIVKMPAINIPAFRAGKNLKDRVRIH
ncbi:MAG TPA: HU family DNA-binding protein [Firmicutes bacterium]|jgi:DNA-binding protein HU-beta|nr:HU family DNA-binding protein [Bacillota bacterium]